MIPNSECRCEIDPNVRDRWGIPVLRFHWKWGAQELALARHATATLTHMMNAMGCDKPLIVTNTQGSFYGGHETGTARMGNSASDSVLNAFGQSWDVRNLYIADGASFAGHAGKHATETLMALAWRASDHLADSLLRKDI
jgi:choline dehydrogenase-like flavoprotein